MSHRTKLLSWGVPYAFGAIAAIAASGLIPASQHDIGPAEVNLEASLGLGHTVLEVPPFGTIDARTHLPPFDLHVVLTGIDPRGVATLLEEASSGNELVSGLESNLGNAVRQASLRWLLSAALVGGLAAALLPRRRLATIALGALGGAIAVTSGFGLAATSYEFDGFDEPRYSGILERAPQFIQAVREESGTISAIPTRLEEAAGRLVEVLRVLSGPIPGPDDGTVALLHVSDIHSNPIGLEITRQLVEQFAVVAVVDTGDLTSFGDPLEARLGGMVAAMGVPYLWVPGNHDSPDNRGAVGTVPAVRVLQGQVETVAGIKILGWADPTFTASAEVEQEEADRAQAAESDDVARAVEQEDPDILAVHNPRLAERSVGSVPLILSGHTHRRGIALRRGTWHLTVGSTGATGLGSFLVEKDLPYEAEIVYLRGARALATDYVRFSGLGRDFQIDRRAIASEEAAKVGRS